MQKSDVRKNQTSSSEQDSEIASYDAIIATYNELLNHSFLHISIRKFDILRFTTIKAQTEDRNVCKRIIITTDR